MIMNGIFDAAPASPPQQPSLVDSVLNTYFNFRQLQTQDKLLKINLQRAQAGQPQIDIANVKGAAIQVAPDAATQQAGVIGGGVLLALVGVGVLALMLKK